MLFADGWTPLRMYGKKKQTMPLAAEPNTGDRWTPRGTGATCHWKYAQHFMHDHCYRKVCGKWNPLVLDDDPRATSVLLVTTYVPWRRNEGNAFLHCILTAGVLWMHSLDPQPKWQNAEWCAQTSPRKKIAWCSQGALKIAHVTFFSQNGLALYQPTPVTILVSGQYYHALLQDKVRWLFTINNQNCWSMVSFCNATPVTSSLRGTSGK